MRFLLFILPFFVFFSFKKETEIPQEKTDVTYQAYPEEPKKPFEIYPNPVSDKFTLKSNYFDTGDTQLFIYDISGKVVLKHENVVFDEESKTEIFVETFSSGLYLVQLRSGNYSVTKKIVKN